MVGRIDRIRVLILGLLLFLLTLPHSAQAHNGAVAIAVPMEGITVDGDLSDWPAGMVRYPLARAEYGDPPQDESDFGGTFRIGYQAAEQALYIAVDVEDESTVITTSASSDWNTQDGCEIYVALGHGASSGVAIQYAVRGDARLQGSVAGAVRRTGGHHTYEWKFTLSQDDTEINDVFLGLDVVVCDKDADGSFSWMAWGPGTNKSSSVNRTGLVWLTDRALKRGKIRGEIRWEDEGTRVGKVHIQSLLSEDLWMVVKTDQEGIYEAELPQGPYWIASGYKGHMTDRVQVEVEPGREVWAGESLFARPTYQYGYFSDEFYYLACAEHLAWGYVDHPPLSIALLALSRWIFGDGIWVLRLLPILAMAGAIVLTGLMARRLGAGAFGQGLATLAAVVTPMYLALASFYSMNPFDLLFWCLGAYVILGILKNDTPKGWLLFGLIAGLGLQNKLSMGFFGLGLCVALVLTSNRKYIVSKVDGKFRPGLHLWGGGALAMLIFLPHLIWQVLNGWPTIEFMRNSIALHGASPLEFLSFQVFEMHPFNLPIWLAGLYFYLFNQRGKRYRMMGIIYVSVFILLILKGTRAYYLWVAYPMLFAGGAVLIESFVERGKWRGRILKPVIVTALVAGTAFMLPGFLPVLPPRQLLALQESAGIPAEVPQHLYDRLGWEAFVAEVARVYETLPEEDRKKCVIFTGTYHEAGAIDFFGKKYGLPPAISYHNNYHLWGPGDTSWDVVIAVGGSGRGVRKDAMDLFDEIVEAGRTSCEYWPPGRDDAPIYVCREPKRPIAEAWAEWKMFN